jgi:serine/threonine protein kinase/formylglycine-generating enzyme required for sulfatase activity
VTAQRSQHSTAAPDTETLPAPDSPPVVDAPVQGDLLAPLGARFEHVRFLGAGGMGVVHLARDRQLDRLVAVKRIALPSPARSSRLVREARLTAQIEDPHVVRVYDVCHVAGAVYILSEYIEGESLDRIERPVPWTQALAWGLDLARGLAAAHEQGILHRDIKPANAIVEKHTGQARLIDFGVATLMEGHARPQRAEDPLRASTQPDASPRQARPDAMPDAMPDAISDRPVRGDHAARAAAATGTGSMGTPPGARPGTPRYQAPEIWDWQQASTRSDVYSLGVLLYELCTGREPPVVAEPATRRPTRVAQDDVDERFAHIVNRCIELDPAQRYGSGAELREALARLQAAPIAPENPYRGLLCFHERHRSLFFGRELDTDRIVERMRAEPFLLLVGESGIGKSSLAHAGVLPRLRQDALDPERTWTAEAIVPGRRPLAALAQALGLEHPAQAAGEGGEDGEDGEDGDADGGASVAAIVSSLRARHDSTRTGLVLFVDQLEELLTVSDPGEARRAQALLAHLIEQRLDSVRILGAVRGDHLTALAELPELGGLLQEHIYLVRALDPAGVRAAIIQPAQRTGVTFESDELVEHLLQVTLRARAGMPLLQFVLAELWAAHDTARGVITRRALDALGGVEGALARYADDVLDGLPRREQRAAAQRILVELVAVHHRTRVRCTRRDLVGTDAMAQDVLERLVQRRLVVCHQAEGEWVYAIAHEALLSAWPTLRGWLDRESELVALRAHLADAAQQWHALSQPSDALWGRRMLHEAERLDLTRLSAEQAAFLSASRRALFRKRWLMRGTIATILALITGSYAISRWQSYRALQGRVSDRVAEARQALERASELREQYLAVHALAQAKLQADAADWDESWREVRTLDPKVVTAYRDANQAAEAAYMLDPGRDDAKQLLMRGLEERAWFADVTGRHAEREELTERLAAIDDARAASWRAPVPVTIQTTPAGATVEISRYDWRPDAPFTEEVIAPPARAPFDVELTPGSYLVVVHAAGDRIEVRYPLIVSPLKISGVREEVSVYRPRTQDVPDKFVYVSEGSFWSGYGQTPEQEGYRTFHATPPLHRKRTGAYLVRAHETTIREWLAYVDACTNSPCPGGAPARRIEASDDDLRLEITHEPGNGWRIHWQPDPARDGYRAMAGEPLIYESRQVMRSQDWLEFPISGVSWVEVQKYLAYLREVRGVRDADLCTEAQWERAARGADDRMYPHGNGIAAEDANIDVTYGQQQSSFGPDVVGAHPQSESPFGLHDMAGNVAEMTRPDPPSSPDGTDGEAGDGARRVVVRGGSLFYSSVDSRSFSRWDIMSGQNLPLVGFRVCAAAPSE